MSSFLIPRGGADPPVTVLVVDADSRSVQALGAALREAGYTAIEATTFAEGKRVILTDRPGVVVIDIRLEQFNGLQLLMRARAEQPGLVAIMTCSFSDPVLEAETRRLGGTYLVKPVEVSQVLAAIRALMHTEPAGRGVDKRQAERRKLVIPDYWPERRAADRRVEGRSQAGWPSERRGEDCRKVTIIGFVPERRVGDRRRPTA